jgi:hypothetical protein
MRMRRQRLSSRLRSSLRYHLLLPPQCLAMSRHTLELLHEPLRSSAVGVVQHLQNHLQDLGLILGIDVRLDECRAHGLQLQAALAHLCLPPAPK